MLTDGLEKAGAFLGRMGKLVGFGDDCVHEEHLRTSLDANDDLLPDFLIEHDSGKVDLVSDHNAGNVDDDVAEANARLCSRRIRDDLLDLSTAANRIVAHDSKARILHLMRLRFKAIEHATGELGTGCVGNG